MILCVAGHVDHGKTCLVQQLTGIDADRLPEEKRRGITIESGFASLSTPDNQMIGIVDLPGHGGLIHNMLAGVYGADAALLVVAADEGIMPQTREHLAILQLIGVQKGLIALTKIDRADPELCTLAIGEIRAAISNSFLQDAPILPVSARTGAGMELLREALCQLAVPVSLHRTALPFYLPIDRIFQKTGIGTIVTGTVIQGRLGSSDTVCLYPAGIMARVRGLQAYGQPVTEVRAGMRAAISLRGCEGEDLQKEVKRGGIVAQPDSLRFTRTLDVSIRLLPKRGVKDGSRLHFYAGAAHTLCRISLCGKAALLPEEAGVARLRFEEEIAIRSGERFILRFFSPEETIGGGLVLDCSPTSGRFRGGGQEDRLYRLAEAVPERRLEALLRDGEPFLAGELAAQRLGLTASELAEAVCKGCGAGWLVELTEGGILCLRDRLEGIVKRLHDLLEEFHLMEPTAPGMSRAVLRQRGLQRASDLVAEWVFGWMKQRGEVCFSGGLVALCTFVPHLAGEELRLGMELLAACETGGLSPPDLERIETSVLSDWKKRKKVVDFLVSQGDLVECDGIWFHHAAYAQAMAMRERLMATPEGLTIGTLRDALHTSRKFSTALIAYWQSTQ